MTARGNTIYVTGANMNTRNDHFVGKYDGGSSGISDLSVTTSGLYPNPASSSVTVHFSAPVTATISVTDMTGQEMKQTQIANGTDKTIAINDLASGLYLVRIETANGQTQVIKLVKE